MEFMFMLLGLGFFLYVIQLVERSEDKTYARRLNEMREFGYQSASEQKDTKKKP